MASGHGNITASTPPPAALASRLKTKPSTSATSASWNCPAQAQQEAPSTNLQAPDRLQTSSSKLHGGVRRRHGRAGRCLGAWGLVFLWSLVFGVWSLHSTTNFPRALKPKASAVALSTALHLSAH